MVLPIDAPTPRLFAEKYNLAPQTRPVPQTMNADLEANCRHCLVEVGSGGTFLEVHAKSRDPAIVQWGFDYLLKKFTNHWGERPHLIVAHGAQWSRDSKRDFKVVGGKVVELDSQGNEEDDLEEP